MRDCDDKILINVGIRAYLYELKYAEEEMLQVKSEWDKHREGRRQLC